MSYNGGKNGAGVWQRIINEIPPHTTRFIPFGGHCAITRQVKPCAQAFLIEKDESVCQWWEGRTLSGCRVIHGDALLLLPVFEQMGLLSTLDTFVYLDPPYLIPARRSNRRLYKHELTEEQHRELLSIITRLKCRVAISGYHHAIYDDALSFPNWRNIEFPAMTRGGHVATEVLWMNYEQPAELHDDRWLDFGKGWRERDRIKKKVARLAAKLRELPLPERRKLASAALAECSEVCRQISPRQK